MKRTLILLFALAAIAVWSGCAGGPMGGGCGSCGSDACGSCGAAPHVCANACGAPIAARAPYGSDGPNFVQGPPTGAVTYPYYTVRGPRDFLLDNPRSIGP